MKEILDDSDNTTLGSLLLSFSYGVGVGTLLGDTTYEASILAVPTDTYTDKLIGTVSAAVYGGYVQTSSQIHSVMKVLNILGLFLQVK